MSGTSTRVPDDESLALTPRSVSVTLTREQLAVCAIVVGQAVWLGFVMMRGWYSAADLPNLAYANGRSLDWDYLSSRLGGHFGAAQRLVYWLLNRTAPLEWWFTVLVRLAFQALTTVLLWRLLRTLVGARTWVWIVLVGYAFSAYLVPGTVALNSGLGLGISQACLVGAMLAQVRYTRERRLVDAVIVAVLVLAMLAFAQQSLPTIAFLPILSFMLLQQGDWREGVRAGFGLWRGWAILAVALATFAGLYLAGDYNSPTADFAFRDGLWLAGQGWLAVLGPTLVGGPWEYYSVPNQWSSYADPPLVVLVLGQLVLVGLIALSVRRTGWLALVAWLIPIWTAVASLVLVGTGRWWLGEVLPSILRYSYFVPVAFALGVALAFGAKAPESQVGRWRVGRIGTRKRRAIVLGGVALLILSSATSTIRFAARFWQNPAKDYTATVMRDAHGHGPGVQLFDTLLPEAIVPYISEMDVSDLLGLAGASADFEHPAVNRLVVDGSGRFVPARFVNVADYTRSRTKGCGLFVRGQGTTRIPLSRVKRAKEWFLQLELYEPRPNRVTLRVLDKEGDELTVTSGSSMLDMTGALVVLHRRLDTGVPATLELRSSDPGTNFCLVHTYVGVPMP